MSDPVPALPAATVVLVRGDGTTDHPFEVFFVRRHGKAAFMANAYVFPGGRVDPADSDPVALERLGPVDLPALARRMDGLDAPEHAGAHLVAAARETFEEAGILLARHADGRPLDLPEARLADWRARVHAGEAPIGQLLRDEDLVLTADALAYLAHWVTPHVEKRRFDARFFIARAPHGQRGAHDTVETTDSCWLSPQAALAAYAQGGFTLAPPTWRVLVDLCRVTDATALDAIAHDTAPVQRIMPHFTRDGGTLVLALPGDPLHPDARDPAAPPHRIVLLDGRWAHG